MLRVRLRAAAATRPDGSLQGSACPHFRLWPGRVAFRFPDQRPWDERRLAMPMEPEHAMKSPFATRVHPPMAPLGLPQRNLHEQGVAVGRMQGARSNVR
jgi:hypothetical protein